MVSFCHQRHQLSKMGRTWYIVYWIEFLLPDTIKLCQLMAHLYFKINQSFKNNPRICYFFEYLNILYSVRGISVSFSYFIKKYFKYYVSRQLPFWLDKSFAYQNQTIIQKESNFFILFYIWFFYIQWKRKCVSFSYFKY